MASNHRPGWLDRLLRIERSDSRDTIEADVVELSDVSAGAVEAQKATLSRAFARSITAQDDVSMTFSAALSVHAGGDVSMTGSATPLLTAGRDARLSGASAGVVAAREARVESGMVGVLLAGSAELGDQTRVLMTGRDALLLGAAVGIFFPLVTYLLRRFAPPPEEQAPRPGTRAPVSGRSDRRLCWEAPACSDGLPIVRCASRRCDCCPVWPVGDATTAAHAPDLHRVAVAYGSAARIWLARPRWQSGGIAIARRRLD